MRFRQVALLGVLLLLSSSSLTVRDATTGKSTQVSDAQSALVQAFVLVQQADLQGASPTQISQLANNLNLALQYEENATRLSSDVDANISLRISNTTATQALSTADEARTQTLFAQVSAYSIAVAAAFGSALVVLESHYLYDIVRKIRLRRIRIE